MPLIGRLSLLSPLPWLVALHEAPPLVEVGRGEHVFVGAESSRFDAVAAGAQRLQVVRVVRPPVAHLDDVVDLVARLVERAALLRQRQRQRPQRARVALASHRRGAGPGLVGAPELLPRRHALAHRLGDGLAPFRRHCPIARRRWLYAYLVMILRKNKNKKPQFFSKSRLFIVLKLLNRSSFNFPNRIDQMIDFIMRVIKR